MQKRTHMIMITAVLAVLLASPALLAQEALPLPQQQKQTQTQDYSDEQLLSFGNALQSLQEIQTETERDVEKTIEESPFEKERLDELVSLHQEEPEQLSEELNSQQREQFNGTMESISELYEKANTRMVSEVEEEGLQPQEFNAMSRTIQQDQELLERLQKLFMN